MNKIINNIRTPEKPIKRITRRALCTILPIGIITGSAIGIHDSKNKDKEIEALNNPTSISDENLEEEYKDLLLTENFDINNEDEVRQRANAILKLYGSNDLNIEDIVNLIYFVNGAYANISYSSTDSQVRYEENQEMFLMLYKLLNANYADELNRLFDLKEEEKEEKRESNYNDQIFAYMLMADDNPGKRDALKLASVVLEHLKDIKEGNTSDFESNAFEFYNLAYKIKEDDTISNSNKIALYDQYKSNTQLYSGYLTKEQMDFLQKNPESVENNLKDELYKATGSEFDTNNHKDLKLTEHTSAAHKEDRAKANAGQKEVKLNNEKVVDEGGKKVASSKKVVSEGTTKVVTRTFTVDIDEKSYEVTEKGGKVIDYKEVTEKSTTKENTTKDECIVESTTRRYVDSDITKDEEIHQIDPVLVK